MSSPIGSQIKDKIENNEDFRDGFMQAVIMLRLEEKIVEIGKDKMKEIFNQLDEVDA